MSKVLQRSARHPHMAEGPRGGAMSIEAAEAEGYTVESLEAFQARPVAAPPVVQAVKSTAVDKVAFAETVMALPEARGKQAAAFRIGYVDADKRPSLDMAARLLVGMPVDEAAPVSAKASTAVDPRAARLAELRATSAGYATMKGYVGDAAPEPTYARASGEPVSAAPAPVDREARMAEIKANSQAHNRAKGYAR